MEKLSLTDEEKIIFRKALDDAYMAGKGDAFISSGARESVEDKDNAIEKVFEDYCETKNDSSEEEPY